MITALDLKCEYLRDPTGVTARHPRLSWTLHHPQRGQSQSAFQILVASAPERLDDVSADLWDTGKVRAPYSMAGYAGVPLTGGMRCFWTVRAWDAQDQPGPYSPPAVFEMGPPSTRAAALEPASRFSCSDERLNRIYQSGVDALPGNLEDSEALLYAYDATLAMAQWIDAAAPGGLGLRHLAAAWQLFMLRGDARPMSDHYPAFKAWVDARTRQVGPAAILPGDPLATADYYYTVLLLYEIAGVIGRAADKEQYAALFDAIDAAFNAAFWDEAAGSYGGAADPMALYLTMVPAGRRPRAAASLAGYAQRPGIAITPYLLDALTAVGFTGLAYNLVTRTGEPAGRSAAAWIIKAIGGISADTDPDYPAFQRFSVRPHPAGGITWANLSLATVRGPVEAAWQVASDGAFYLAVNIPVGSTARIDLPRPARAGPLALTEGGVAFWQDSQILRLPVGVQSIREEAQRWRITAGSGGYTFEVG